MNICSRPLYTFPIESNGPKLWNLQKHGFQSRTNNALTGHKQSLPSFLPRSKIITFFSRHISDRHTYSNDGCPGSHKSVSCRHQSSLYICLAYRIPCIMALSMGSNEICSSVFRRHFQSGMEELVSFAQSLIEARTDLSACHKMKRHILSVSQEMDEALEELKGGLRTIDAKSVELVAQRKRLEDERQAQTQQLKNLRHQLDSHRNLESKSREMLDMARKHLEEMQRQVSEKEKLIRYNDMIADIGVGLMVIPVTGWIAGGVLVGFGLADMEEAERAKRDAEAEVNRHSADVDRHATETNRLQALERKAESNIQKGKRRLSSIRSEKQQLASQQAEVVLFQNTLRKCVTFLAVLAGKTDTAEFLCTDVVIYEELERILEEILNHVFPLMGQGKETHLMALSSANIRWLIERLKSVRGMLSLHAPRKGHAIDF
ncbi:uncharacterized protein LOC129328816 isoform X1 [Eublepharis macularius]|uniref:Uncharacterized protein LOC129328816 isoform X1 n=1 Tax=Eublepharis macularius TaxID=481883 RepID=A0AA97KWN4_EUBMA|nr:uncharacterized protein LOC129328816 isoform X1 [Eublepharis macularius]